MLVGRPQGMKLVNESLVRTVLRQINTAPMSEIVQLTGLSQTTVGQVLGQLESQGQIRKLGLRDSSGGRPAAAWTLAADCLAAIVLIMEATRIVWGICDALGQVSSQGVELANGTVVDTGLGLIGKLRGKATGFQALGGIQMLVAVVGLRIEERVQKALLTGSPIEPEVVVQIPRKVIVEDVGLEAEHGL